MSEGRNEGRRDIISRLNEKEERLREREERRREKSRRPNPSA